MAGFNPPCSKFYKMCQTEKPDTFFAGTFSTLGRQNKTTLLAAQERQNELALTQELTVVATTIHDLTSHANLVYEMSPPRRGGL